ncbi:MAG: cysteine desulfurase-like protein [Planctomycetes bacterium]|nr:cysteine desulfurase-like protein [Planctomycetota bacterium]
MTRELGAKRVADVDAIRRHFPALARVHAGLPVAYFDGPGGTQVPRAVVDAMSDYIVHHNANTHWRYPTSAETDAAIESARRTFADFLNATPEEIAFGPNMTTLTFHLARALGRAWGPGDEVVVTELDHHANVAPWRALAKERGVTIRQVALRPESGQLDWADLERAIGRRTKLVAIGAASNALGTITDVRRAGEWAHAAGALVFVDAVHYAPHALVDVKRLDCDFLACSPYKFYGPHLGVLFGRRALLESLDVPKLEPAPDTAPERIETGTQNHEGIVGAAAAVDFLASLAAAPSRRESLAALFAGLHARGERQLERLWRGLGAIRGVTLYGPPPGQPRTPTLSFTLAGKHSDDVAELLAARGLFLSSGDFYAEDVIRRIGCEKQGVVRVGCVAYTTDDEVARLIDAVHDVAR